MSALLELVNLSKSFGGVKATNNTSLTVNSGEIHAIIGPNGAGKTTLVHQISGALAPDAGEIRFGGRSLLDLSMHERVALGLARSYQIVSLFGDFTVLENVALAIQARSGSSMSFWSPVARERALNEEAMQILKQMSLQQCSTVLAQDLGHGEQRQLEIALAVATRPKMLLLDEPLAGMSGDESDKVVDLIISLKETTTILLVEHDMDAVFRVADRISCLVQGQIVASGTPAEIRNHPEVKAAYLGDEVTA